MILIIIIIYIYSYNFHKISITLLEDIKLQIGKYEKHKSYYDEIIDCLIKDKLPINYMFKIIKPINELDEYIGKSDMYKGIITKRINSSIIINDYTIQLNRFYLINICEAITQQRIDDNDSEMHRLVNIKSVGTILNISDYDLHDYTIYDIKQPNNDNIDFID